MLDLEQFTGFTPGPWDFGSCHTNNWSSPDEKKANSRLARAAPELLAECKRLRAELAKHDRAANILACLDNE